MAYPFSENIQRGIIYLLKTDTNFYSEIVSLVKSDYFEYPIHGKMFSTIQSYYEKYKILPSDENLIESIRVKIPNKSEIEDYEDELEYINSIEDINKSKDFYLDCVEEFSKREAMKVALAESVVDLKENKISGILDKVKEASQICRSLDIGQDYFEEVNARLLRSMAPDLSEKIPTIYSSINASLKGGLSRKELAFVVAAAGVGKSIYLANQAVKSLTGNFKVAIVSLEMSEDRYANRIDSIMTLISNSELDSHPNKVKDRLKKFKNTFSGGELQIKEFPTAITNVNHIRSWLNQLRVSKDFVPDVLIVDYLELLEPIKEGLPDHKGQERVAQELRGLGQELNMLVWTATQCNREGSKAKIVTDSELADSYGKIRTADLAISLNQDLEEFDSGRMRAYIIKNRNGRAKFIIPTNIDYSMLVMREIDGTNEESNE